MIYDYRIKIKTIKKTDIYKKYIENIEYVAMLFMIKNCFHKNFLFAFHFIFVVITAWECGMSNHTVNHHQRIF